MKKSWTIALMAAAVVLLPFTAKASEEIAALLVPQFKLVDNGKLIDTSEDTPIMYNEKTYVPLRLVSEALGYEVTWDGANQAIHFKQPEGNYPLLKNEGVQIVSAEPKYDMMTSLDSTHYLGSISLEIVYEVSQDLDREPVLALERLNKDQTVLTTNTQLLNKKKGVYKTTILGDSKRLPYDIKTDRETVIKQMQNDYFYRYKLK
ncbi:stalk domain-containing protein [Paenibacillus sp. OAS669]|uniref:stalk domain-containing protein n=1 Tax=Paenibacillus sp. OAS669 TaxID=2663821 RepID=UPI0019EE93AA|nr:stalk domain-containing protein [Paenibacillus sp. OAS669]MBE1444049.1 hypothetical protein [Paenibacillus sp. OAS669]